MSMITVVGGGFAGVEAAWAAGNLGQKVRLYEMRPQRMTPAHTTGHLAELVCSNSFKSQALDSPAGQLKSEMIALGSLVIPTGQENSVPGGSALAVDREKFAAAVTERIDSHPMIEVVREEANRTILEEASESGSLIISAGPLASESVTEFLTEVTGSEHLYFYDAVSPTVDASTIDYDKVFAQSRYDKGEDDYLNCPMNKDEYEAFIDALLEAEQVPLKEFEKPKYFEGCKPIEEIAAKGRDSLRFGNFKPVGLTDPKTGRRPWAVIQLRPENRERTLYSLVACQNRLKWGPQLSVLRTVPGLEQAEFVRLGVIHRNTYIEAPKQLDSSLRMVNRPSVRVAGQLCGVEGYVESAAMGIYAGLSAVAQERGVELPLPPRATAYGSLVSHLQDETPREFAPMNINWGLFPEPEGVTKKAERREGKLKNANAAFAEWKEQITTALGVDPSLAAKAVLR